MNTPHEEALALLDGDDIPSAIAHCVLLAASELAEGRRAEAAHHAAVANLLVGERPTREALLAARGPVLNGINAALEVP